MSHIRRWFSLRTNGISPVLAAINPTSLTEEHVAGSSDWSRSWLDEPALIRLGLCAGTRVAVDAAGNAYVAGLTTSTNFPNTGQETDQLRTTFIAKLALG